MPVTICRKENFNAAHRLDNPAWSAEENKRIFGKCNSPHYHGHNYDLIVKVTGEIQADSGFVMDVKVLGDLIKEEIVERFDHKNLNLDCPAFKAINPTAENICVIIWQILREKIDSSFELAVTLYETDKNFVEYRGE